ncbi:glycoside hydrolase family 88 protein [bacterium]|nr:glycoside hydrolase family 88 protein [bacterium]
MIRIDSRLFATDLLPGIRRLWDLSAVKIRSLAKSYDHGQGTPVFTVQGRYTTRGWTEWTQGFEIGSAILQYDATDDAAFLKLGRRQTVDLMAPHLTHVGVHDHGFNNVSTYGNLLRLMREGRLPDNEWERRFYELALKCSGAVQAGRWTRIRGGGYIYSFNGPHSLFVDTIRSLRALALAHQLGHVLMGENDHRISLLERLIEHAEATATYSVYYGKGRDAYDVRGRVAHEGIFNVNDGRYRCPNSQQGYSPFSTWTRGLAWAMLGFAEQLEFLRAIKHQGSRGLLLTAARATCEFYLAQTPVDGVPYWDTGAPGLAALGDYLDRPADPFNEHEPVDSSAAAIAAQGLLRLGNYLGRTKSGRPYWQAGLTVLRALLEEPYLATDKKHQGLLLHSVYHRPNGWDHVPAGRKVPCGESSMWGDYHLREAVLLVQRVAEKKPYPAFWSPL